MGNDEILVTIKDMFEKSMDKMEKNFDKKIDEVKVYTGTLVEDLRRDVRAIAEGHSVLDRKIDNLQKELVETKQELKEEISFLKRDVKGLKEDVSVLKEDVSGLKKDMIIVKDYVIGVDTKLNEHEVILNRVK
ncbi:MAG: hypothetical protein Q8920_07740 [Bacillota bacterium]|nr:hypothetical protein [Bacillota bacterium]